MHRTNSNYSITHDRYLYQGSEMDEEVKGSGNSYTTTFRQLDPRLGRWMSLDPVFQAHQSPYNSMDNNPIWFNDQLGNFVGFEKGVGVKRREFRDFKKSIRQLRKNSVTFNAMYKDLNDDKSKTYTFKLEKEFNGGKWETETSLIRFGLHSKYDFESERFTRFGILAHEVGHAWRELHKLDNQSQPTENLAIENVPDKTSKFGLPIVEFPSARQSDLNLRFTNYVEKSERAAMNIENIVRSELIHSKFSSMQLRQFYIGGIKAELIKSNFGNYRYDLFSTKWDVLIPPFDKNYYLNNKHNIHELSNVKPL